MPQLLCYYQTSERTVSSASCLIHATHPDPPVEEAQPQSGPDDAHTQCASNSTEAKMEPTAVDQNAAQDSISGAISTLSISDVNSGVFPAYSSRESIGSDASSIGNHEATVEPEHDISPCYNFVRGIFVVFEFDQGGNLEYKAIPLDEVPESSGRFHCMDCSLHFEDKTQLQIHLLRAGEDLHEDSTHIVCPVCFTEFMPPNRVEQWVEHIKSEHDWELQFVMHGKELPKPFAGYFDEQWREFMHFSNDGEEDRDDNSVGATGVWLSQGARVI